MASSLIKTSLNRSLAEGIYNEILSRYSRYYYFLGRTLIWEDETSPPYPIDSYAYELATRNEIISLKQIKPTDVAFVIPRYNWTSGTVYDPYDDQYSTEVQGVNLINGGLSYATAPYVYIGTTGSLPWTSSTAFTEGQMVGYNNNYYIVTNTGISDATNPPTHTSNSALNGTVTLKYVNVTNAGGTGATATATVTEGAVVDITLTHKGTGYTSIPTVTIAGSGGASAYAEAVVTIAPSGAQRLEEAIFYVVTDEFNVYKCLNNNLNTPSTIKPTGAVVDPIQTADGYMWKFLFNIPIALRNKFLTDQYVPVISALREQFYSGGALSSIRINTEGKDYTSGNIIVQGDGYASDGEQQHLTEYVLGNGGSDYNEPVTVTVDPPITGVAQWQANTLILTGQHIQYGNNIYNVSISGYTDVSVPPIHRYGDVMNGTAALKFVGTVPTSSVVVTDGSITDITFYGMIAEVQMLGGGSGYTSPPAVNFIDGNGTGAVGVAVLNQYGAVTKVQLLDPGYDFTSTPSITFGTEWSAGLEVTLGQQLYYSNRLYTVTEIPVGQETGTTDADSGNFPVAALGSSETNGDVTLECVGEPASASTYIKYGFGYNAIPEVHISGAGGSGSGANVYFTGIKTEAKLVPVFDGGHLIGVQIDDPGVGYTYVNLTVEGDGSGATIAADLSPGDINTLQANIELLTNPGQIMACNVVSGGYGYGSVTVNITGDGTGAAATATVLNGSVQKITMTSYGSGYTWANLTLVGNGWGAKARAVISPYGGHGKNTLSNLFVRQLMFYSNMSQDTNQGFEVNNDYRQIGIIKALRSYGGTGSYTSTAGSACWVVSGNANTTLFPADALITKVNDDTRFRIVTNNGSALLVQSLDNSSPVIGSTFMNSLGDLFTCSAVTAPTVDKYSGSLMFIDNRAAFTPTADQTVTMRTVIKF